MTQFRWGVVIWETKQLGNTNITGKHIHGDSRGHKHNSTAYPLTLTITIFWESITKFFDRRFGRSKLPPSFRRRRKVKK